MDTAGTAKGDDDIPEIKYIFDNIFHCQSDKIKIQTFNVETGVILALQIDSSQSQVSAPIIPWEFKD